ncbi:MAG: hypothetical protein LUD51_06200 [Clostridia bacterium]|nr:hypothetical protein [Clostridia bacterium]
MKKTMLKAALLAAVCCAVGAVCAFGACGDSGTFDEREPEASDYANFKTYMTDTLAYDGSFTIAFNFVMAEEDDVEMTIDYVSSYDSENDKAYMSEEEDGSSYTYYYVNGTDGITEYYDNGNYKRAYNHGSDSSYAKYFNFYDYVTQIVEDPSDLSTEADVSQYIVEALKKTDGIEFEADNLTLTVKGENGSIYYIVKGNTTESYTNSSYEYSTTMQVIFTDGILTGVSCYLSEDYYRDGELYRTESYDVNITVSYEWDSSIEWPTDFSEFS